MIVDACCNVYVIVSFLTLSSVKPAISVLRLMNSRGVVWRWCGIVVLGVVE